ncbi:E3 ubiquitin-protein ligase rnf146-like [Dendronephthya gigantea]|uniref:E3 ubiquitin-protein ligase rnf146-like n=1 Tax=Dendronephthya gigantea TaxID=151771 RepID=UPI00106AA05F|nr:E3 ubiquitin-protein ligase rnf146-like [Dendronephthya gigantea]XP_028402758.1 E3 ubiquitin-protein ligase rnf146-like [Dendronephthya gigantea]XP_028402759.1 E3 ubiquitin-protein ligase rnf146-like [Dendronephthya gigantea]XP_028402760.1 E3 ubiquitin-protein ligase rnf146-like [Dendronephthya gigantea]
MAEQVSKERGRVDSKEPNGVGNEKTEPDNIHGEANQVDTIPDCPVCLQTCTLPVKLLCGHIFCFLCIKGVAFRSRRCALCRQDVDLKYFDNPKVVQFETKDEGCKESAEDTERYQWYYEGRNGWWQYEESCSAELEKAHRDGKRSCELPIAGFLYFVDFENMVQFRKTEPGRQRRIKRDVFDAEKKGVAGLRLSHPRSDATHRVSASSTNNRSTESAVFANLRGIQRLVIGSSDDNEDNNGGSNGHVQQDSNSNSS